MGFDISFDTIKREAKREWDRDQRQIGRDLGRFAGSTVRNAVSLPFAVVAEDNVGYARGLLQGVSRHSRRLGADDADRLYGHYMPHPRYSDPQRGNWGAMPYAAAGAAGMSAGYAMQETDQQPLASFSIPVGRREFAVIQPESSRQLDRNIIAENLKTIDKRSDRSSATEIQAAFAAGLHPDAMLLIGREQKPLERWVMENTHQDHRAALMSVFEKARQEYQPLELQPSPRLASLGGTFTLPPTTDVENLTALVMADKVVDSRGRVLEPEDRAEAINKILAELNSSVPGVPGNEAKFQSFHRQIAQNPSIVPAITQWSHQASNEALASNVNELIKAGSNSIGREIDPQGHAAMQQAIANSESNAQVNQGFGQFMSGRPSLDDLRQISFGGDNAEEYKKRLEAAIIERENWDKNPMVGMIMKLITMIFPQMDPTTQILAEAATNGVTIHAPESTIDKLRAAGITATAKAATPEQPTNAPAAAVPAPAAAEPTAATPPAAATVAPAAAIGAVPAYNFVDGTLSTAEIKAFEEKLNGVANNTVQADGTLSAAEIDKIKALSTDGMSADLKGAIEALQRANISADIANNHSEPAAPLAPTGIVAAIEKASSIRGA